MRKIAKLLAILLACTCLVTGCSQEDEKEQALQAIRDASSRYSFLNAGRNACQTITGMLSYYDNASYQEAKAAANVSDNLRAEYFPTVTWQGSEFLAQKRECVISDLLVSSYSDKEITYLMCLAVSDNVYLPISEWYKVTYSLKQGTIIGLEEICEY